MLDAIAQIDNEKVITTSSTVRKIVDLVSPEIWRNPNARILDPMTKGGEYLKECALRLWDGLKGTIPDKNERRRMILHECLYGMATEEICAQISRRTVYCAEDATNHRCIERFERREGNIIFQQCKHTYDKIGKCTACGCRKNKENDQYAYPFLHMDPPFRIERNEKMEFDLIIGNPPYQLMDGGHGPSASPLYHKFWQRAVDINPREIVMVIPARWYTGGRGLDDFREAMLRDKHIEELHDFLDSGECFPDNKIAGGVCFIKWKRNHQGDCLITQHHQSREYPEQKRRPLDSGFGIFIRKEMDVNMARKIVERITETGEGTLDQVVSAARPFGLRTYYKGKKKGKYALLCRNSISNWNNPNSSTRRYVDLKDITSGKGLIDKWKIAISAASGAGKQYDKTGRRSILSVVETLKPEEICTETYLTIGPYKNKKETELMKKYLDTKFVRYLIGVKTHTQHFKQATFSLVPNIGHKKEWTDEMLYNRYDLSEAERKEIEQSIKPRAQQNDS